MVLNVFYFDQSFFQVLQAFVFINVRSRFTHYYIIDIRIYDEFPIHF